MPLLLTLLLAFDLSSLQSEPNLEKRSALALKNADAAVTAVRDASQKGDDAALMAALDEVRASVDAAVKSLSDSGVNPRKSKYYKQGEQSLRQLLRRLDGLLQTVSAVDQDAIKPVRAHVSDTHDKLIAAIMARKK